MEQQIRKAVLQNPMALDMLQLKEGPVLLENLNVGCIFLIIHSMCLIPCELSSSRFMRCCLQLQRLELPPGTGGPPPAGGNISHHGHHCDLDPLIQTLYN